MAAMSQMLGEDKTNTRTRGFVQWKVSHPPSMIRKCRSAKGTPHRTMSGTNSQ
jgi:hypothetical protein